MCPVNYFNTCDLDTYLVRNSPGRSTFNTLERRMAPLNKDLGGVLLEHKHFGVHMDDKESTIDPQLDLKNFEHAGNILRLPPICFYYLFIKIFLFQSKTKNLVKDIN